MELEGETKLWAVSDWVGGQVLVGTVGAERRLDVHAPFLPTAAPEPVHSRTLTVSPSALAFSADAQLLATGSHSSPPFLSSPC